MDTKLITFNSLIGKKLLENIFGGVMKLSHAGVLSRFKMNRCCSSGDNVNVAIYNLKAFTCSCYFCSKAKLFIGSFRSNGSVSIEVLK